MAATQTSITATDHQLQQQKNSAPFRRAVFCLKSKVHFVVPTVLVVLFVDPPPPAAASPTAAAATPSAGATSGTNPVTPAVAAAPAAPAPPPAWAAGAGLGVAGLGGVSCAYTLVVERAKIRSVFLIILNLLKQVLPRTLTQPIGTENAAPWKKIKNAGKVMFFSGLVTNMPHIVAP